jgi:hypothetical protein
MMHSLDTRAPIETIRPPTPGEDPRSDIQQSALFEALRNPYTLAVTEPLTPGANIRPAKDILEDPDATEASGQLAVEQTVTMAGIKDGQDDIVDNSGSGDHGGDLPPGGSESEYPSEGQQVPLVFDPLHNLLSGENRENIAEVPGSPDIVVRWLPYDNVQGVALPSDAAGLQEHLQDTVQQLAVLEAEGIVIAKHQYFIGKDPRDVGHPVAYAAVERIHGECLDPYNEGHELYLDILANNLARYLSTAIAADAPMLWDVFGLDQYTLTAEGQVVLHDLDPFVDLACDEVGDITPACIRAYEILTGWGDAFFTEDSWESLESCRQALEAELGERNRIYRLER